MKPTRRTNQKRPAASRVQESAAFALPDECSISSAADLKGALAGLVDMPEPVTLDASAVRRIDTACLQLLSCFARERRAASRSLTWSGMSTAFGECADLLDLRVELGLPAESAAVAA